MVFYKYWRSILCIKYAMDKYHIKSEGSVIAALKVSFRTAGKMHWALYSKEFEDDNYRFNYLIKVLLENTNIEPMICIDDSTLYNSKTELSRQLSVPISKIRWQLDKERKFTYNNKTYILLKNY